MRKLFFSAVAAFALAAFVACGGGAPKLEGTEVVKADFAFIQPTGWEVSDYQDGDDIGAEVKGKDSTATVFITIKSLPNRNYEKEVEYYNGDEDTKAIEDFQADGITFKTYKRQRGESAYYILIAPRPSGSGTLSVSLNDDRLVSDPMTRQIAKDIIATIKPAEKKAE